MMIISKHKMVIKVPLSERTCGVSITLLSYIEKVIFRLRGGGGGFDGQFYGVCLFLYYLAVLLFYDFNLKRRWGNK